MKTTTKKATEALEACALNDAVDNEGHDEFATAEKLLGRAISAIDQAVRTTPRFHTPLLLQRLADRECVCVCVCVREREIRDQEKGSPPKRNTQTQRSTDESLALVSHIAVVRNPHVCMDICVRITSVAAM